MTTAYPIVLGRLLSARSSNRSPNRVGAGFHPELAARRYRLRLQTTSDRIERDGAGTVRVHTREPDGDWVVECGGPLVATGRIPDSDQVAVVATDVGCDLAGWSKVQPRFR